MERVRFIEHRGVRVLFLDYSNLTDEHEMLDMVEHRTKLVSAQAAGSVLTLADITGAQFSRVALTAIKQANAIERPAIMRAALVGSDKAIPKGAPEAVDTFSAREHALFDTREDALDWLIGSQPAKTSG